MAAEAFLALKTTRSGVTHGRLYRVSIAHPETARHDPTSGWPQQGTTAATQPSVTYVNLSPKL